VSIAQIHHQCNTFLIAPLTLITCLSGSRSGVAAETLKRQQLRSDLDAAVEGVTHQQPDYHHSTEPAALKAKVA
jgi:hypothetical protein